MNLIFILTSYYKNLILINKQKVSVFHLQMMFLLIIKIARIRHTIKSKVSFRHSYKLKPSRKTPEIMESNFILEYQFLMAVFSKISILGNYTQCHLANSSIS